MYKIFFLFLLGTFITSVQAQTQISGTITNEQGEPLTGATVYLPEHNKGTVSNAEGHYQIRNLPSGTTKIQFSFLGYQTEIKEIKLGRDTQKNFDIGLKKAIIKSQEVVVTGMGVSSQHDNAVKIEVLKSKEISQSGTPKMMQALTNIPGVDMIAKGQGVAKPVIRGLSMNDILVMINGVRIENYQYGENHPLGVDNNHIDKVEVIKGPASLLYGSDAIGGVINFTKEKPAPTGNMSGSYMTQLHSNTRGINNNISLKGASENIFGSISANHKTHADYKQGSGQFVPNSRFNEWSLSTNSGYTGKNGTFRVFYDYYNQELGMSVPPVQSLITEANRKNRVWYQDLEHHLVNARNTLFLGDFKWHINGAWQSALRKLQTEMEVPAVEMRLNTMTFDTKLELSTRNKINYTLGMQGMNQKNRNLNNRQSQFLPDANVNNFGILFLTQYSPTHQFKIQGGIRYDYYRTETFSQETENHDASLTKDFSNISGSLGATWTLNQKLIFRGNLAKAFRAPNIPELTSQGMHGTRFEEGNPNLSPQNAWETDFSSHFHGDFVSFDGAIFYNRINDYIHLAPTNEVTSEDVAIYRYGQTDAQLFGGEAGLHVHPESAPWLHIKGAWSTVTGKQENGNYLPFIPADKFRYEIRGTKNKLGFIKKPSVKLSAISALEQDQPSPGETSTEGYTVIHATINGQFQVFEQPLDFTLGVNNLFNKEYIDHLSTLKNLGYRNQGRNVFMSLQFSFGR